MGYALAQDTLRVYDNVDITALTDTLIEELDQELPPIDCSSAVLRSWRNAFPFQRLSEEAYEAARADTLLNKKVHPFRYSRVKLASDSIKTLTRINPTDPSFFMGMVDYRLPIFVSSRIPEDKQKGLLDLANDFSYEKWYYVEPADSHYQKMIEANNLRELQVYNYAKGKPNRYSYTLGAIELPPALDKEEFSTERSLEGKMLDVGEGAKAYTKIGGIQSQVKTDVWHKAGSSTIQMSQTALTDNWYKGGDNNMTASTVQRLDLTTYDENKKTSFDVILELRLSTLYTKADTVHSLRVNDNQFSATIKYGYQAWKRWYYSSSIYAKTPVFDFHNANSKVVKSAFLSPLEVNVSVGMEYKYQSKDKKATYTLLLAPAAYNLKYVASSRVNATSYGIEEGKSSIHKFGSSVSSSLSWKITDAIAWTSRFYYFTSYDSQQVEFENTFSFNVSRRFTCQLYLYPRFDDSRDEKIQMKEMLTFGVNYVW